MTSSVRLPLILMSVVLARQAVAQTYAIDRGVWQPGGGVRFSHGNSGPPSGETTFISVGPGIGYFVLPGVLVRGGAGFYYRNDSQGHSFGYGANPGVAYYFRRGPHTLYPYVRGNVSFNWYRDYLHQLSVQPVRTHRTAWTVSAGAVRLLTSHFGLTGEAYYGHSSSTSEGVSRTKYTVTDYGLEFGVAFFVY